MTERDQILLVQLADGTLRGWRRTRAEARLHEIPDGLRLLERQRRVRGALWTEPPAPVARAAWPRMGLAGALAALLLALALVRPGDPSVVAEAAALAHAPATAPASPAVLQAGVDGVAFPDWSREFGWNETGARRDSLDGRSTATVFYEHMGHRIAYTILPGPPAEEPENARIVHRDGTRIALTRDGDHTIAVFERGGRTCVIAGHVERESTLVKLAAWNPA